MSFFRPDPTGDNTDFDLRRVTVDNPENPTMFFYRGSSTDGAGNNNAGMEGAGFKISTFANDVSKLCLSKQLQTQKPVLINKAQ